MQEKSGTFPFMQLDVYRVAKELAVAVHNAQIRDTELRDQAARASKSAFLNLCEGLPGQSPAMRRKFFASAAGSAAETAAALDLSSAIGAAEAEVASHIIELAIRLTQMLRRLG